MTQEDKQLLLKDLCARLPYMDDLKVARYIERDDKIREFIPKFTFNLDILNICMRNPEFIIKPYLRPMSSMTEVEYVEFMEYSGFKTEYVALIKGFFWSIGSWEESYENFIKVYDWLNAHHFDYRGLIEKGLALEAPKGMYKID